MTNILKGTTAIFLLISGAFYNYGYNTTALVFLCLAIALSLATLFSIRNDNKKSDPKNRKVNLQEFNLNPNGYYTHPDYSFHICINCLTKNGIISPVLNGFCTVCKEPTSETLKSGGEVFNIPYE